jgi:uncharacterized repeat protein (TIGR02543 family)
MTGVTGDDFAILPEWENDDISSSVMAVVNNAGVTDLDYMNWFPSGDHANASGAEGSLIKMDVLDNPDVAWEASAGRYIIPERKDKVPAVFIIHGDNDSAIHIAGSVNQYNQLLANGNYAEFHREIGGAHSLHSSPDRLDAMTAFVNRVRPDVKVTGFTVSDVVVGSAGGVVTVTFEGYGFQAARANLRVLINGVNPTSATVVSDTLATSTVAIQANRTYEDVIYKLTAQLNTLPTGYSATVKSEAVPFWTVTFDSDGGSAVPPQKLAVGGSLVAKPADPVKEGYVFVGWYYISPDYTTLFNFDEMRASWDLTLTAKWEPAAAVLLSATPVASVKVLSGNQNELTIVVTEKYSDNSVVTLMATVMINNNASGTYSVGNYTVYVDTKGNDQIRVCHIVESRGQKAA